MRKSIVWVCTGWCGAAPYRNDLSYLCGSPITATAASILNPAATCCSSILLESGDVSHVRPCPWIVWIPPTRNVLTQLTRNLWEVAGDIVTSCWSCRCAFTEDSEDSGDRTHYTSVKCVNITSAVIVWRVVDITVTNGHWRGVPWRKMTNFSCWMINCNWFFYAKLWPLLWTEL